MARGTAAATALASAVLVAPPLLAQEERPGGYREEARVERVVVDAYVTGSDGQPIPNLAADDFRLTVDGRPVPIESAEWIPADVPEIPTAPAEAGGEEGAAVTAPSAYPRGRLLILFFQTSFEPTRLVGFMRMAIQAHRFVEGLLPTDRVAVLSF